MKPVKRARPIEEREELEDLLCHKALPLLVDELETLAKQMFEGDVLNFELGSGNEAELIRRKCRLDGGRKLVAAFKLRLQTLKPKQDA